MIAWLNVNLMQKRAIFQNLHITFSNTYKYYIWYKNVYLSAYVHIYVSI